MKYKELEKKIKTYEEAVEELCINLWIEWDHSNPYGTLRKIIKMENDMALDPLISQDAVDLIEKHGGKFVNLREDSKKFSKFIRVFLETEGSGDLEDDNKNLAKLSGCTIQEAEKYKEIFLKALREHNRDIGGK